MKGSAQQFITCLATEMGSPFKAEKHQTMQSQSDFLGLVHDVGQCHHGHPVRFWPRDRLITKVTDLMDEATQHNVSRQDSLPSCSVAWASSTLDVLVSLGDQG